MDIQVRYISAGLARCDRNGMSMSGAIATLDEKKYYFSIYSAKTGVDMAEITDFLEVPENMAEACPDSELASLLEDLRNRIELEHGRSLTLDLSKCSRIQE